MSRHEPRRYRKLIAAEGLVRFEVAVGETDVMILAESELRDEARAAIRDARRQIESHAALTPDFLQTRRPLPSPDRAPGIVDAMYRGSREAGTGPMAAVAGAIAEHVARALAERSREVIVENGGDIFAITSRERLVAITAPGSPLDGKVALAVPAGEHAICTSSGTVGHSASAGRADAVVIVAPEGALADAVATAAANRIGDARDVQAAIDWARDRTDVRQVVVVCEETLGVWGQFELRRRRGPQ